MVRAAGVALVSLAVWAAAPVQEPSVLHVKVSVLDADRRLVPVVRHALLISDNPATSVPIRVVTSPEGAADTRLRPGKYTVESERPFVFDGLRYEWTQMIDVTAGRDVTLDLTVANATVDAATPELLREAAAARTPSTDASSILSAWQGSAFALWAPYEHATGFLADVRGLVATSLRAIGSATAVEVQISTTIKVAGNVVVADSSRDVAVIRVNPAAIEGIRAVPLACDGVGIAASGTTRYTMKILLGGRTDVTSDLAGAAAGGPVFTGLGPAIGLTSPLRDDEPLVRSDVHLVGAQAVCDALDVARSRLASTTAPDGARLPVEPVRPLPAAAIKAAAASRGFSLNPYQMSASDFDITFVTPVLLAGVDAQRGRTGGRATDWSGLRVAADFENWSNYVIEAPPVLFVRATPRLVEGFWMKVVRGAAMTQGAQLPPIKRMRPGFSRMVLLCGMQAVTPIHPFKIQARVTETDAVDEGFYAFDPAAIGPHCGTVSIVLSSVKEPDKTETRTISPTIVNRVWEDFAAYRAAESN